MNKDLFSLRWAGLFSLLIAAVIFFGAYPKGLDQIKSNKEVSAETYVIAPLSDAPSQILPAIFPHEIHVEKVDPQGEDTNCAVCHADGIADGPIIDPAGHTAETFKTAYHEKCIGCHTDLAKASKPTGPLEASCRSCHVTLPDQPEKS